MYTWDYHTSTSIWNGLRVQPILSDEVQTFKALILVHKVLQEGHPIVLREAQAQIGWFETCARTVGSDSMRGYAPLIRAYVSFILAKLRFHRHHREFNGLFEYEEYISLKNIDNPDEGYETIMDLMNLQDQIDQFQKLVFAHFRGSANNECRISSLVPLVKESYGIYKFLTSMLRAMHRRTDAMDALEPLRGRYNAQHYSLRRFYYECANLKYLTSLINVPKLNHDPPNLFDSPDGPELPPRKAPTPPPAGPSQAEIDEQARMLKEYEDRQKALRDSEEAEKRRQAELAAQQQRDLEEQQRQQAERERLEREALMRSQMDQAIGGRTAELEREILAMRGQYERDQLMLQQYDNRVNALENELATIGQNVNAQLLSKDDLLKQLQDQVSLWRSKYEALAKLYSQLRTEHLDMLAKFKQMQLKAGSAQEAIDKMERMERDVKAKNLELADMIRDRDRARFDLDRIKASQKEEVDRLKRDLMFANERAEDATRAKSSEVSGMMATLNRQIAELEEELKGKRDKGDDLARMLDEKDAEIAVMQEGMDSTIKQLTDLQLNQGDNDSAVNAQIDTLILDNDKKLNAIIDSILQSCLEAVDDTLYELESPAASGNANATPEYVLTMVEKASNSAGEFATTFSLYLSSEMGGEHVEVIKKANTFCQAICEVLLSTKGVTRLAENDDKAEQIIRVGRASGDILLRFFGSLQSYRLAAVAPAQRHDAVVRQNMEATQALRSIADVVESLLKSSKNVLANANGDIGDLVEREMSSAARAIEEATRKLQDIMARPKDTSRFSAVNLQVHDSILEASLVITRAIGGLIKAATEAQQEIVAKGRGSSTNQQFYKKNNRWTEGLISAARAVAFSTTILIEAADGVISGTHNLEQLIVASNEVSASTAQLIAASRVKSEFMSKTQDRLELAAKAVTDACRSLVKLVKTITEKQFERDQEDTDYSTMAIHEFKTKEMEQQVECLRLEKELAQARQTLGAMRRAGYHATDE